MRLLSYNIRYGGTGREAHLAEVICAVAPDLVVLQEATIPRVVEQLAAATGLTVWDARPGNSLAYMSRQPLAHHEWHRPPGMRHAMLELVPADFDLRIYGLHLSAIHSNWTERRRMRELQAALHHIEPHRTEFHALVGDFNTLAPDAQLDIRKLPPRLRPFVWLSGGRVRWATVQMMLDAGYVDAGRMFHSQGAFTFPTWDPHLRLDYLFLPAEHASRLQLCEPLPEVASVRQASDHLPLLAQFASHVAPQPVVSAASESR